MRTEKSTKAARLAFFRELYQNARDCYSPTLDSLERHINQYRGTDVIDGSSERASTVRNITYEIIESQVSSDIPPPKVDPACYSEHRQRNARSIERLLCSIRDKLPYEQMNDLDERFTYIYGASVWYAEWDNSVSLGGEVGGVRVYCLPPRDFVPQPCVCTVADMEYCFLRFTTTKSEIIRRYGISEEDAAMTEIEPDAPISGDDDGVASVIIAFYKDEDGEIGKFVFSGEATLLDLPKAYSRKRKSCKICGGEPGECDCKKGEFTVTDEPCEYVRAQLGGTGRQAYDNDKKATRVPYYTPKSFPIVIRKNTSSDGELYGQSDCEYIRPEQQAINKIESRILQKLLRAGVTPIMPEDATVTLNNSVFGQIIRMKPGESAAQYGKVDTTPDVSQDISEAERLYDHSKRILGISDALQGLDSGAGESGYSRQLRISQASGRLESKRKMKHTAYAELDRIIFELYLAFADEPRALVYKDAYGRIHDAQFSRYDFIEYDVRRGEFYYDDGYLFSVDLNGGVEYQREALWQRNLENLRAGTLGNPESPITLLRYWQCQERAHYPYARENVEYFTLAVEAQERDGYGSI